MKKSKISRLSSHSRFLEKLALKVLDLGQDKLSIERALGVHWCIESDAFKFRIELKDQPGTRRGMLSTISSVYDSLGIIAPVILIGKRILQEICHGSSWDEPVEGDVLSRWENWRSQLPLLETLSIPRCFKPTNFGKIVSAQLHMQYVRCFRDWIWAMLISTFSR